MKMKTDGEFFLINKDKESVRLYEYRLLFCTDDLFCIFYFRVLREWGSGGNVSARA